MKKLAQEFGSENDTQELRDRMHEGRSKTSALAKETTNVLKTPASDKVSQEKLRRQLQKQLADFEKMAQEHRRQEREILVQMEEQFTSTYNHRPEFGDNGDIDEEVSKLCLFIVDFFFLFLFYCFVEKVESFFDTDSCSLVFIVNLLLGNRCLLSLSSIFFIERRF
jgi:hypothetical protein